MDFAALAQECAPWVAPATMEAIVKTESGFRPLAIGINGGAKLQRQAESAQEAIVTARWLIAKGYNIDLGLGQVNSSNLTKTGLTVEDAFDPCKNVAAAATILHWNYKAAKGTMQGEQEALLAAVSAYNTGSFSKGFDNGYVRKVLANAPSKPERDPQAVQPIALVQAPGATTPAARPAQARATVVRLRAANPPQADQRTERKASDWNVDATATPNVMVY